MEVESFQSDLRALSSEIGKALIGKPEVIEEILICLMARGHALIEDVPGVGKTTLGVALAQSIRGKFRRIQFTSDLLPSDVIGVTIFNADTRAFEFKPGPVFANVILADEINRTTPKTQSALLEAMQDGAVTVDGCTHSLPSPFIVIATQNPIEFHGTYPLPESQLDRFLMRIQIGYPDAAEERRILTTKGHLSTEVRLEAVCDSESIRAMQDACTRVRVDEDLLRYVIEIVSRTRAVPDLELGASPRGGLSLHRASQARAFVSGRSFVTPDDVKSLVVPVLAHRLIVSGRRAAAAGSRDSLSLAEVVLREVVESVEAPV